ncbi:MAG: response regulator [bacterium]
MDKKFVILIADRNPNISDILRRELFLEGYNIKIAYNGFEVLTMVDSEPPDIVILDLDLPYMDGLEVLEKFHKQNCSVPVIVHSLLKEYKNHPALKNTVAFVEKAHNSIDSLKALIAKIVRKI